MKAEDLLYKETYKRCLSENIPEYIARDQAVMVIKKYRNNQFNKASELIDLAVTNAKKIVSKKSRELNKKRKEKKGYK